MSSLQWLLSLFILIQSVISQNIPATTNSDRFSLCHKLNEYGCNPTKIPQIVEVFINNGIADYTLPTNPCLFDTINMSLIFNQVDASVLDLVNDNSYFATIPCQLLIQLPSILISRNISYLVSYNYWFGDNINNGVNGQCDTVNITNNPYNITTCNYTISNNMTWNISRNECVNDDKCYYPFVVSKYATSKLSAFGMCHCVESCQFKFYGGNIEILDIFNQCCIWISLILIIGYFINLWFELKKVANNKQKIMDLPITFDIPFFCASALFLLTLCQLLPYFVGKDYFSCEYGTKALIRPNKIPYANWSCFIQGSIIYLSIITIYTYFMILSFSLWRYLYNPLNPLYGIHKKYLHLVIWIYILGLYIALVCDTPNGSMGANNILGICGSHLFTKPESYIFNWYPLLLTLIGFGIITPLTIYKLFKTMYYGKNNVMMMNNSGHNVYNKELIHLIIRLLLYTFLLCASCICFMYIIGELLFNQDKWTEIVSNYVYCLVFQTYFIDIGLNGDLNKCILDPFNELPISIYFMQGTVIILASSASFILSCSNTRYNEWKNIEKNIVIKMKSVGSMTSNNNNNNNNKDNICLPSPHQSPINNHVSPLPNLIMDAVSSSISTDDNINNNNNDNDGGLQITTDFNISSPPPLQLNTTTKTITTTQSSNDIQLTKI